MKNSSAKDENFTPEKSKGSCERSYSGSTADEGPRSAGRLKAQATSIVKAFSYETAFLPAFAATKSALLLLAQPRPALSLSQFAVAPRSVAWALLGGAATPSSETHALVLALLRRPLTLSRLLAHCFDIRCRIAETTAQTDPDTRKQR